LLKVEGINRLNNFAIKQFSRGGNLVLVVDEAQNLDNSTMENLRLLSNLETRKHKLIQIVLSGQPELDIKLAQPELRQLAQRISLKRYITPFGEKETYEYVQHRLSMVEYNGPALFSRQAQKIIWKYSGGVPRKINVLCDNALLIAYAMRQNTIQASVIEEAIRDLTYSPFSGSREDLVASPVHPAPQSTIEGSMNEEAVMDLPLSGLREDLVTSPVQPTPRSMIEESVIEGASMDLSFLDSREDLVTIPVQSTSASGGKTSHSRLAVAVSLLLAVCLSALVGFLLATSQFDWQESGLSAMWTSIRSKIPIQLPLGNSETSPRETGRSETLQPATAEAPVVVVEDGDNLTRIISQTYGRVDPAILSAVLEQNPEIQDPDHLVVGQVIKLPAQNK
jgi:general secretion pathway protein A